MPQDLSRGSAHSPPEVVQDVLHELACLLVGDGVWVGVLPVVTYVPQVLEHLHVVTGEGRTPRGLIVHCALKPTCLKQYTNLLCMQHQS